MTLAGAITNLQAKALALSTVSIKSTPATPIDSAPALPVALTYLFSGSTIFTNASQLEIECVVKTNFYFPRGNLPEAYTNLNNVYIEFIKDVAADPTLGGSVTSVRATNFEILFQDWNGQAVVTLSVSIPLKILDTPG